MRIRFGLSHGDRLAQWVQVLVRVLQAGRPALLLLCGVAWGQGLPSLVDEALRSNREVLAAQKRYEAAKQRPSQERSLPDPMVSVGYTAIGAPYPGAGLGRDVTANVGVMVSQEMPAPGKRPLRGAIAEKDAAAEFDQYRAVRLNVIA